MTTMFPTGDSAVANEVAQQLSIARVEGKRRRGDLGGELGRQVGDDRGLVSASSLCAAFLVAALRFATDHRQ
jgi:hypothetical protein